MVKATEINSPKILSVGFAVPEKSYTQEQVAKILQINTPRLKTFFKHKHIEKRHLLLPEPAVEESTGQLIQKFKDNALRLTQKALLDALQKQNLTFKDIDYICCVTSTGFLVPGLTSLLIAHLGLRSDCQRADLVGMGCSAGVNGLATTTQWAEANPGKIAVLICCEICSAIYSIDESESSTLANSLFADGVAATIIKSDASVQSLKPKIIGFSSHTIENTLSYLRFDWDEQKSKYRFFISRDTPKKLAAEIETPLNQLLKKYSLQKSDIKHWIIHSGGAAILDAIQKKLELNPDDLRHTRSVLKDYGNVSSGSILFSFARLENENRMRNDDYGVIVAMGPGLTIEMALIQWVK